MNAADEKGPELVPTPGGDQRREALRQALARFIDPDDDTMPAPNRVDGGYVWVPVDPVLDNLITAFTKEQP
ncbi:MULTISPECIES: hypothetical protein [unclassified Streptomyces]|uniref:hypothetical protein n=1 Tax=unclassified Streptomyces TaxID=2593676 RepID=UPI0036AE8A74